MMPRPPDTTLERLAAIRRRHEEIQACGQWYVEGFEAVRDLPAMVDARDAEIERLRRPVKALRGWGQ